MSRRDRTYYWRHVRCEGCERRCRYRDFRPDPSTPSFAEVHQTTVDNPRYPFHRRGTILGIMHDYKRKFWEEHTEQCRENLTLGAEGGGGVLAPRGHGPGPDDCPF